MTQHLMRDPETPGEWQTAVAAAEAYLRLESARQYGLVTGGPTVNVARCEDLIARGRAAGIVPTEPEIDAALAVVIWEHATGDARRDGPVL